MAIIERKRLEWSAQGLARSPVWMLQSDDRPNRAALNSLQDKDGQRNCCHSALRHYLAEKSFYLGNTGLDWMKYHGINGMGFAPHQRG